MRRQRQSVELERKNKRELHQVQLTEPQSPFRDRLVDFDLHYSSIRHSRPNPKTKWNIWVNQVNCDPTGLGGVSWHPPRPANGCSSRWPSRGGIESMSRVHAHTRVCQWERRRQCPLHLHGVHSAVLKTNRSRFHHIKDTQARTHGNTHASQLLHHSQHHRWAED